MVCWYSTIVGEASEEWSSMPVIVSLCLIRLSVCLCVCLAAGERADADETGQGQAGEAQQTQGD